MISLKLLMELLIRRWLDRVRTGSVIAVLQPKATVTIQDYMLLLPVSQTQIDINLSKIKQNPGYGIRLSFTPPSHKKT